MSAASDSLKSSRTITAMEIQRLGLVRPTLVQTTAIIVVHWPHNGLKNVELLLEVRSIFQIQLPFVLYRLVSCPMWSIELPRDFDIQLWQTMYIHTDILSAGFTYRFKQLPKGYALFEIPKPDHSGVVSMQPLSRSASLINTSGL